jgi:pimeloyl-ACP methyl ester carboxylesterase
MYWRETMSVLHNEGYDVHALDFLGQGRSSKPFYLGEKIPSVPGDYDADATPSGMVIGKTSNAKVEYQPMGNHG